MTVRARAGLLVALTVGGALLGAGPAHAEPAVPVQVFESGPSETPDRLYPLSQTAAGLVYRREWENGVWIKPTGGIATYEDRMTFPEVVGDLITSFDTQDNSLEWRTISDPTIHSGQVPELQELDDRTATGYLTARGDGPYELVSVDLLDGGTETVIGTANQPFGGITAGPLGARADVGTDMWNPNPRYFPYATPGTGRAITHPVPYSVCPTVTATHEYCRSVQGGYRVPLAGGAAVFSADGPATMTETSTGVAYTDGFGSPAEDHRLRTWASNAAASTLRIDSDFGLTGWTGPTTTGSAVLVTRGGDLGRAGIWSVPIPSGTPTLVEEAPPVDRSAGTVALAPGSVAWIDNQERGGSVWTRDLDGSDVSGPERLVATNATSTSLSVGAGRIAYADSADGNWGGTHLVDGNSVTKVDDQAEGSTLSGDRLLSRSSNASGSAVWQLRDLSTGTVTTLPTALDYDLWGDRLVRLKADGAVLVGDLRTGAAAETIRAATPAQYVFGTVHVAGDAVGWDVYAGDSFFDGTRDVAVRDVATMSAAVPLTGMDLLEDLSTGYALGRYCVEEYDCSMSAMSLADQQLTPIAGFRNLAVDGNTAAYVDEDRVPALLELPAYADAPRLLAAPRAGTQAGVGRSWTARVVTSRVLTSCAVEIVDADDSVVRTLDCVDPHAAKTVSWDGTDEDGDAVPAGAYGWRITGATGAEDLVDYDGSSGALAGTVTVSDDPAPTVTTRSPAVDGTSVAATANVTAAFSEAVTGVTGTSFRLQRDGGSPVAAVVTYSPTTRTATLNPSADLLPDTDYVATLTGGPGAIRDGAGGPLATTGWTFTTGPAPTVTGTSPATNATSVISTANVIAAFSEPATGVDGTTVTLKTAAGVAVPATVAYNPTTAKVTLNPSGSLTPDTRYTATLSGGASGITDEAGNPLVTKSWSFTTGPAPTVTAKSPAANATGVSRTGNVVAAFSEAVQGIRSTTAVLRTSSGTTVPAVATYSTTSRKVTINPSATLAAKTRYTVTLFGGTTTIRDGANNPLTTVSWSFTTG